MPKRKSEEVPIRGRHVREKKKCRKMRSMHKMDLKKRRRCAIFEYRSGRHPVYRSMEEEERSYRNSFLRQHFTRASNQKTPALKEKSRAASVHLDLCGAHPVSMLFSGAGVPLIGMFQGVASFDARIIAGERILP